jgi:hypothetical protein
MLHTMDQSLNQANASLKEFLSSHSQHTPGYMINILIGDAHNLCWTVTFLNKQTSLEVSCFADRIALKNAELMNHVSH